MKFILKRTSIYKVTKERFLEEDNPFYDRETIEERSVTTNDNYFVHLIELKLNELLLFIKSLDCKSIIMSKDLWYDKKLYTIEIYDDYRE